MRGLKAESRIDRKLKKGIMGLSHRCMFRKIIRAMTSFFRRGNRGRRKIYPKGMVVRCGKK